MKAKTQKGNTFSANTIGSQIGKTTSRFVVFGINGERFIHCYGGLQPKITTSIKAISANRVLFHLLPFCGKYNLLLTVFFYKIYQAGLDKMLKSS